MRTDRYMKNQKNASNKKASVLQTLLAAEKKDRSYGQLLKVVYCDMDTYPLMRVIYQIWHVLTRLATELKKYIDA